MALASVKVIYRAANSGWLLLALIVGSWLTAGIIFFLLEPKSLFDSLYWSMSTMSTVGYGDISAGTMVGKGFSMLFQAWSIFFVVPCAVAHVIDKVRVDEHKMTHQEQEWLFNGIETLNSTVSSTPLPPQPKDF